MLIRKRENVQEKGTAIGRGQERKVRNLYDASENARRTERKMQKEVLKIKAQNGLAG